MEGRRATDARDASVSRRRRRLRRVAKRGLDVTVAASLLLVLSPALAAIAAAIAVERRAPVIYADERVGRKRRLFRMYKFGTMHAGAQQLRQELLCAAAQPNHPFMIASDPRVTRVGAFLRSTSLDELPQLLNVLRGDMSLVGPRPLLQDDLSHALEHTHHWQTLRASVRPGLTGRWQIRTRYQVEPSHDQMMADDCEYVLARSLRRDAAILVRTPIAMLAPLLASRRRR